MDSIRQYDPQKPRRERNLSHEEWQQYVPVVEAYRQNGLSLKDIVILLRTEHGLTISYKRLAARVARPNARCEAPSEAVGNEASDHEARGDGDPIAPDYMDPIPSLKGQATSLEVDAATEARSRTSSIRGRLESKTTKPQYPAPIISLYRAPLAQTSTTMGSAVPADLRDTLLGDIWTQLIEIVSSGNNMFNDLSQTFMKQSNARANEQTESTGGCAESEIYRVYQMADCCSALNRLNDAFALYYRGIHLISQLGIRHYVTASRVQTLVQYLLWAIIGYCTSWSGDIKEKYTLNCLESVEKVLRHHNRVDTGTKGVLSTYRIFLRGQIFETIDYPSWEDLENYHNIFESLHPAIRLREAHFLIWFALYSERRSLRSTSALTKSFRGAIRVDLQEQVLAHATAGFPACTRPEGFLQTFAKAIKMGDSEGSSRIHPCPHVLLLCTHVPMEWTGFDRQWKSYYVNGIPMRQEQHADESVITDEYLDCYLAALEDRILALHRPIDDNDFFAQIPTFNASYLAAIDEGSEQGLLRAEFEYQLDDQGHSNQPVEAFPDTSSVSTDTRSFLYTARRARDELEKRKGATKTDVLGIEERFSTTMSISTNESWKFHRVTNLPDYDDHVEKEILYPNPTSPVLNDSIRAFEPLGLHMGRPSYQLNSLSIGTQFVAPPILTELDVSRYLQTGPMQS